MGSFEFSVDEDHAMTLLRLRGPWAIADAQALRQEVERATGDIAAGRVRIDLSQVTQADAATAAVLFEEQSRLRARRVHVEMVGAAAGMAELLAVFSGSGAPAAPTGAHAAPDRLERIGQWAVGRLVGLQGWLAFFGASAVAALDFIRRPNKQNWSSLLPLMERAGPRAASMVVVVNFVVGIVAAYEYGLAAEPFGATMVVPDFVGLSVVREFAPLMAAIVTAGRTGASFTEELGTVKVLEEIDALRALRLDPIGLLVLPRMFAIVVTLPLLVLMAGAAGILGGGLVGTLRLGMSAQEYFRQTQAAVGLHDIVFGLSKSVAFGVAIALVSCKQGLVPLASTSAVGRRTAATVVSILLATLVIDALFER
jgi:phospholipid/cholesterol/gamma-HCH transport system permease protein